MSAEAIAVFDIGGTYFRSAIWCDGQLSALKKRPAINYLNTVHENPLELQAALVDFLVEDVVRLESSAAVAINHAGISLGAPVNARSGRVLQSGPLWGPRAQSFELEAALKARRGDIAWTIANDVTAGLISYLHSCGAARRGRILFVTVSTGIGSRLYDEVREGVPVDPVHGIQGEIGHIPVEAFLLGRRLRLSCDCGGADHLNAFASGRGALLLLRELPRCAPEALAASTMLSALDGDERALLAAYSGGVEAGDPLALEVLAAMTRPLAAIFATLLTHDPLLTSIVLTGGVVDALEPAYTTSLNQQFRDLGQFQITEVDPDFLARRLKVLKQGDSAPLDGAGRLAEMAKSGRDIHVYR